MYMIKVGKAMLQVDIYDLLDQEEEQIWKNEDGEEVNVTPVSTHLVPFIAYVEASYFGDTDIF